MDVLIIIQIYARLKNSMGHKKGRRKVSTGIKYLLRYSPIINLHSKGIAVESTYKIKQLQAIACQRGFGINCLISSG
jgi:hypothetical protein